MENALNTPDRAASRATGADPAQPDGSAQGAERNPESISSLFSDLWRQTTTLIEQQASLAKAEASEKLTQITVGAGAVAAGGAVLFAGFIVLLGAVVNALAPLLPPRLAPWLAPAIVGLVVLIIGFIMVSGGIKALKAQNLKPTRTVESLRRTGDMVKEHV
ncbi:MAG: phage holin family protein [Burkholderiales bacterium]